MITVEKSGFVGLATNLTQTQAPPGALIDAENVVLRRPQCIEARDGVTLESSMNGTEVWGFSFDGKDIFARYASSVFSYRSTAGDTYAYTPSSTTNPQPFRRDILSVAQARGNVYLPYENGVLKLESGTGQFKTVGVPVVTSLSQFSLPSTGTTWLPTASSVGYRAIYVSRDVHGVERRSLPSGSLIVTNSTGTTRAVELLVLWTSPSAVNNVTAGALDSIEIYRSKTFSSSNTVDDEMQLAGTIPVTSTGNAQWIDRTLEAVRGKPLYTSPSRGGITNGNNAPPACACIELFKGSLFFGNTRGPRRIQFSRTYAGDVSGATTGVGYRQTTANTTAGNPTVNVASATGLQVGMYESLNGGYVQSIVGTTVTMSTNYGSTTVGATLTFYDAIKVGSAQFPAYDAGITGFPNVVGTLTYIAYNVYPPEGGYNGTFVIEAVSRGTGSVSIQATHGDEYNPPLPLVTATAKALDQDTYPGAIYWSKKDEPEHVRIDAYLFVGDSQKAVLAFIPTRDALFILKEDGVFRLTGSGATDGNAAPWRVDMYDPTLFCVLPNSARMLAGRAYFLSNKGIVAFDDGGSEIISLPINDLVKPVIDSVLSGWRSTGLYELPGLVGSFAAVYARENEYTLMRSSSAAAWVFNQNTGAWTTWKYNAAPGESLTPSAIFGMERAGRVYYAMGSAVYKTLLSTDTVLGTLTETARFDRETAVTASGYNASTGVVTLSVARTALENDVIQDAAGVLWRVAVAATSSVSITVAPSLSNVGVALSFTTGSCVLYRSLRCRVEPHVLQGDPRVGKRWGFLRALFSELVGCVSMSYPCKSSLTPTESESDVDLRLVSGYTNYPYGVAEKALVDNNHAHAWFLRAAVSWAHTHGRAKLEAFYAEADLKAPGGNHMEALS